MFGGRPYDVLMAQFVAAHHNKTNQTFHAVGIPLIISSAIVWGLVTAAPFLNSPWYALWPVALTMTLAGLACQFIGHAIEGNRPEVFQDWRFIPIGLIWWCQLVTGKRAQTR